MTLDELYEKVHEKGSPLERTFMFAWLFARGANAPVPEWQWKFMQDRKYAFDFCWPDAMLAVEVQGGVRLAGGGRHNTDADRWKMVYAAALGWRVMGFSGEMLNNEPHECIGFILKGLGIGGHDGD